MATTTENATRGGEDTIDRAIEQVEHLYRTVTGRDAPDPGESARAIPPERSPDQHVEEQIERLMDALAPFAPGAMPTRLWTVPVGVWESREEYVFRFDVPGVARESTRVQTTRGMLEVSGRRSSRLPGSDDGNHRLRLQECWTGEFRRAIPLPPDVESERLRAQVRDGVLEVRVPRRAPSSDERTVPVG